MTIFLKTSVVLDRSEDVIAQTKNGILGVKDESNEH